MRRETDLTIEFLKNLLHIYGVGDQIEILDEIIQELEEWRKVLKEVDEEL